MDDFGDIVGDLAEGFAHGGSLPLSGGGDGAQPLGGARSITADPKLRRELDRLTLANQAMWELLRDHLGFSDEHLRAKITEIDGRDGTVDGKIGADLKTCPSCHRTSRMQTGNCVYCGEKVHGPHVFKG